MTTWQARINAIRESKAFEATVIFVILVAAVLVGAKTYDIPPATYRLVDALGDVVVWIFVAELAIRFLASRPRHAFFKNAWNLFDTIVVAVSLLPVEGSEMALVARLARIFQVLRMIGVITEVRLLLNSLLRAIPQLMYVLVMVFLIFYIYGALGSLFFEPVDPALWGQYRRGHADPVPGDDFGRMGPDHGCHDGAVLVGLAVLPVLHLLHDLRLLST